MLTLEHCERDGHCKRIADCHLQSVIRFDIASATSAASTAARTWCTRTMDAPCRIAATSAATLAVSRE
jgi:hypothetical protein